MSFFPQALLRLVVRRWILRPLLWRMDQLTDIFIEMRCVADRLQLRSTIGSWKSVDWLDRVLIGCHGDVQRSYTRMSPEKRRKLYWSSHTDRHTHTHSRTLIHSHRSSLVIRPLLRLELGQFMENWSSAVKLGSHCLIFLCQHSLTVSRNDRRQFFFADTHKIGSEGHTVRHGKRPPMVESEKKMGQRDPTFRQDYWASDWLPFFCLA